MKASTEQVLIALRQADNALTIREIRHVLSVRGIHQSARAIGRCMTWLINAGFTYRGPMSGQERSFLPTATSSPVRHEWQPLKPIQCAIIPVREGNEPAPDPYAELQGQRYHRVGLANERA